MHGARQSAVVEFSLVIIHAPCKHSELVSGLAKTWYFDWTRLEQSVIITREQSHERVSEVLQSTRRREKTQYNTSTKQ